MSVCSCRRVTTREKLLPGPVLLGPLPRSLSAQVLHLVQDDVRVRRPDHRAELASSMTLLNRRQNAKKIKKLPKENKVKNFFSLDF